MNEANYVSVTELNQVIKVSLERCPLKNIELVGEISGWKISGPHAYFTLKDKFSQIACSFFYCSKGYHPKDGESVVLRGGVDFYAKGGKLSFVTNEIKPLGQGLLALEFEKMKAKLEAEGLFKEEHKKPIPKYCQNVLVITSKTGAVIRDIVTTVRRKNPVINIVVKDVRVQGDGASKDIVKALCAVDSLGYDVIVIARGGGSLEDLAPFYDETLARTIFKMKTPIVSAIGHETDFSLCDFVADKRAPTPTAGGELVAFDFFDLVDSIHKNMERINLQVQNNLKSKVMKTQLLGAKLQNLSSNFYNSKLMRLKSVDDKLKVATERSLERKENNFRQMATKLDGLSPLKTLGRGYFGVKVDGKALQTVEQLKIGDRIETRGKDGKFCSVVDEIKLDVVEKN